MKNKYAQFKLEDVQVNVYYDDMSVEGSFDFGDEKENQDYLDRFNSGELISLVVEVVATDLSGHVRESDILGGVHVNTNRNIEEQIKETIKDHTMISNAKDSLRNTIKSIIGSNGGF